MRDIKEGTKQEVSPTHLAGFFFYLGRQDVTQLFFTFGLATTVINKAPTKYFLSLLYNLSHLTKKTLINNKTLNALL